LDVLLNDATAGKDRLTRAVESAIAAALAELAAIEAFDKATATSVAYPFNRAAAAAILSLFEAWVPAAEQLEQRVKASVARAGKMVGADKLEYAIGKTLARLASATVDQMEEHVREWAEGDDSRYVSLEEIRRELLRAPVPRDVAGPTPAAEPVVAGSGA
jgi:predicted metal-dependent phosphoesterase TrpH